MKIAYFSDTYIPQVNGVTYVVDGHARLLAEKNEVKIYAPAYKLSGSVEKIGKLNLIIERYPSIPVIFYKDIHFPFVDIYKMYKSVKSFNPDIIHFHTPLTIGMASVVIAKHLKIPLITTYHTLWSETLPPLPPYKLANDLLLKRIGGDSMLKKSIWNFSKKFFDYCDIIISPSDVIKDELILNKHKSKITVISNGIDTKKFNNRIKAKTNFKILYTGRLSHEKNVDVLIKAFRKIVKKLPQARMIIVGDGPVLDKLKNLSIKLKVSKKILFTGKVKRESILKYYKECDVFATASEMEVQPLTILEAMACSMPLVGVNKAGVKGLVKNKFNGFLVSSKNEGDIAEKITDILNNNKLRIQMSKNSRSLAMENNLKNTIIKLQKLYSEAISAKKQKQNKIVKFI